MAAALQLDIKISLYDESQDGKDCGKLPKTSGMQPFATPAALDQGVGSLTRSDGRIDANWTKARELAANLS
jgi:hypothetical protein